MTVAGISISGADAGNYNLSNTTATCDGRRSQRGICLVSATGINKVYDGTTSATVTLSTDKIAAT